MEERAAAAVLGNLKDKEGEADEEAERQEDREATKDGQNAASTAAAAAAAAGTTSANAEENGEGQQDGDKEVKKKKKNEDLNQEEEKAGQPAAKKQRKEDTDVGADDVAMGDAQVSTIEKEGEPEPSATHDKVSPSAQDPSDSSSQSQNPERADDNGSGEGTEDNAAVAAEADATATQGGSADKDENDASSSSSSNILAKPLNTSSTSSSGGVDGPGDGNDTNGSGSKGGPLGAEDRNKAGNSAKDKRPPPEALGLDEHIDLYTSISEELWTNIRQERDWNQLYEKLNQKYDWMSRSFASVSLFKQRCKLLMEERRKRQHVATWKNMKSALTGPAITVILEKRLKLLNVPPSEVPWDFSMLGDYFAQRIQRSDRSPGSILDWPQGPKNSMISKLMALHKYYGYGSFYQVHEHVDQLVQACEVELAILSTCDCVGCSRWKLTQYRVNTQAFELRLRWTRKRAEIMRDLLELHRQHPHVDQEGEFATLVKEKIPVFENWRNKDINLFLHAAHSSRKCNACEPGSRPKRPYRNRKFVALQAAEERHAVAEANFNLAEQVASSPAAISEARRNLQLAEEGAKVALKAVAPVIERAPQGQDTANVVAAVAAAAGVSYSLQNLGSAGKLSPRFPFYNPLPSSASGSLLAASPLAGSSAAPLQTSPKDGAPAVPAADASATAAAAAAVIGEQKDEEKSKDGSNPVPDLAHESSLGPASDNVGDGDAPMETSEPRASRSRTSSKSDPKK
ncbi:Hypothetical Protein FCC1311_031652 [Hondaea fermentalgiana]|uniref:Uncharacterized protein n=1 Tax=Hondaea fermentalgiana TaxID=2315210 RepID=A0A2R5G7B2_9STRA|nr:Hypothetical Protein FCC1311_031652 [Hondaea fermentalgiana]|eukprot:GBG26942.1 Hypothetical Protein FCC1311_031652 [Hondaea fermentalgiana]